MLILFGHNDTPYLGSGWHPPQEGPAGLPCRWMSQRAKVNIPTGRTAQCTATITISAPATIHGMKPGLSLYFGDSFLGHCQNLGPEGHWSTAIISIKTPGVLDTSGSADTPAPLTLAIEHRTPDTTTPLAFIPHEILKNGDLRELGALISSIRIA